MPSKQLSSLKTSVSFTFNLLTFDRALKKVPKRVESCVWASLVTFLQSSNKTWSQRRDLKYDGDARVLVMMILTDDWTEELLWGRGLDQMRHWQFYCETCHGQFLLRMSFIPSFCQTIPSCRKGSTVYKPTSILTGLSYRVDSERGDRHFSNH